MSKSMFTDFKLTDEEYAKLDERFGALVSFASWQLKRKNSQNNVREDVEDFIQDLRIALIRAGVYYKRQVYIEECLNAASKYAKDSFVIKILGELEDLWANRTKHGANKQKFGEYQERILEAIVRACVPEKHRPDPKSSLKIDKKFTTYCKQITWNQQKSLGRKITRERGIRNGMVSLSQFDFAASSEDW